MHGFHCELNLLCLWGSHMGKLTVFSAFCWQNGTRNFQDFDCQVRTVQAPRRAVYRISTVLPSLCWWSCRSGSLFIADHDPFMFFWSLDQVYLKWFAIMFKNCPLGACFMVVGWAVPLWLRSPSPNDTGKCSSQMPNGGLSPHCREGGGRSLIGKDTYQQQNLFLKEKLLLIQKVFLGFMFRNAKFNLNH